MMKIDDFLDTYYFTKLDKKRISKLAKDFPSIFTEKKKVPINFQLRFREITERTSQRISERRDRVSFQNRCSKVEFRRRFMIYVLETRADHKVFEYLCDEEEQDYPIWYYIDKSEQLVGPLPSWEMQELFETHRISAQTMVKKKLSSSFLPANFILNKYCRLQLFKEIDRGYGQHFSSPKSKGKEQTDEQEDERDAWLRAIGKLPEKAEDNPMLLMSRPESFSKGSMSRDDKRTSFSFKNPRIFDETTKDTDPSELFSDKLRSEKSYASGNEGNHRKRSSLILEGNSIGEYGIPKQSFRKRVSTTTFKKSKK